jgi:hypothetical protein
MEHLHYLRVRAHNPASSYANWRTLVNLPFVQDTTLITVVTDSATCALALPAFNTTVELADSAVTEVEVIRVGSVYVVSHPLVRSGEWIFRYIFNSAFGFIDSYFNNGMLVVPPPPPVITPSDLHPTTALDGQVQLAWTTSATDVTSYRLQRATGSAPYAFAGGTLPGTARSAIDTTAQSGNTYRYRLVAYRSAVDSGFSNVVTVTLTDIGTIARTTPGVLYRDQFDRADGGLGTDWQAKVGPPFRIVGNKVRPPAPPTSSGGDLARVTDSAMMPRSGMCLQADMTSLSGGGSPMIMTQLSSGANLHGWILLLDSNAGNVVRFYSVVNGAGTALVSTAGGAYAQNVVQTAKQCTSDGSQRVWLNGQLVVNLESAVLDGSAGTVGLRDSGTAAADASWDDVVVTRSNSVSIAGLPVGYKLRIAGITSAAATSSGVVTLDLQQVKFPIIQIEILDGNNVLVKQFVPTDGVWGGDDFSVTPAP